MRSLFLLPITVIVFFALILSGCCCCATSGTTTSDYSDNKLSLSSSPIIEPTFKSTPVQTPTPSLSPTVKATLTATPTIKPTITPTPTEKPSSGSTVQYIGNSNTKKFHLSGCRYVSTMSESNKVYMNSRDEAINGGFVPCKVCDP